VDFPPKVGYNEGAMLNEVLIANALRNLLGNIAEETRADLDGPIREIAVRLSQAVAEGRVGLADEISKQLEVLIRVRGIRLKRSARGGLGLLLQTGVGALIDGIIAALPTPPPRP
jgi:hypothetical protein